MLQARTAVLRADQAGHPGLHAWLRGLQSLVSYWAGRYAEAVRYANTGAQYAQQTGGTTSVWLPISAARAYAARAYAALGNAEQAKTTITEAEQGWTRVQPDEMDEMGGICTFSHPRTLYYAADAAGIVGNDRVTRWLSFGARDPDQTAYQQKGLLRGRRTGASAATRGD